MKRLWFSLKALAKAMVIMPLGMSLLVIVIALGTLAVLLKLVSKGLGQIARYLEGVLAAITSWYGDFWN